MYYAPTARRVYNRRMTAFLLSLLILLSPLEPVQNWPRWADESCLLTVAQIVQHETLYTNDPVIYRFMVEQILYDRARLGCDRLTDWRWKIGQYSGTISPVVRRIVSQGVMNNSRRIYPKCQYVGYPGDLRVWPGRLSVDCRFERNGYTVIGVNCTGTKVP